MDALSDIALIATWYHWFGNCDTPEYRALTKKVEGIFLRELGEEKIKELSEWHEGSPLDGLYVEAK